MPLNGKIRQEILKAISLIQQAEHMVENSPIFGGVP
jgi:hypothetical protein